MNSRIRLNRRLAWWTKNVLAAPIASKNFVRYLTYFTGLLLALAVCTAEAVTAQTKPPANLNFRHVLPAEVEAIGLVGSIAEDAQGFMWFGGDNGLARYDGYKLKIYRHEQNNPGSISSNGISHLLLTRAGDLWIATYNGLNRYDARTDRFIRYSAGGSDDVRSLLEDADGGLWLASTNGFYHFDPKTGVSHPLLISSPAEPEIDYAVWAIAEDQDGIIWIGHNALGVTRYNPITGEFRNYRHYPDITGDQASGLTHNSVRRLLVDSRNTLWVGTFGGGLHKLDRERDRFVALKHHASEKSDAVLGILEDQKGFIWLGDGTSIHIFNPFTEEYSRFRFSEADPTGPGNHVLRSIFKDKNQDIWVGYFPSGVDVVDKRASVFHNYSHHPHNSNSVADGGILAGFEDAMGNLWVGAGFGLNYFDRTRGQFTLYQHNPQDPTSMSGSTVLSILQHDQEMPGPNQQPLAAQTLWVGIWDRGLNRRDPASGQFIHYLPDANRPGAIAGREPWDLLIDHQGVLWVVTEEALNRYNPQTDTFTVYFPTRDQINGDSKFYGRALYEDAKHNLWVGGVHGLYLFDRTRGEFIRHYRQDLEDPDSIRANFIWTIYEDSREQLWLGTNGGGLNLLDRDTGKFTAYGVDHGLADPVVTGVVEDEEGYLWLSTLKGLMRFDSATKSFRHYDKNNGLSGNLFNRNTPVRLRSGELFFGNSKGFTLFRPGDLEINTNVPPVVLTDLLIFNQTVTPGTDKSPLQQTINTTSTITLGHDQSVFSVEFAALNYRSPELNEYAYRLEGFDNDWNYIGRKRTATYTNLSPGTYVLQVKAANNDRIWNEVGTSITINILPPFWRSWWAYLVYSLLVASLIYWFVHTQQIKLAFERSKVEQERAKVEQERSLVKRLRAVDKLRDDFLANTSHELRTPLNGIIGLAQSLFDGVTGNLPELTRQNLSMIVTSGKRLTHLVDNILDFSKLKNHSVSLRSKALDLYVIADMVLGLSRPLVGEKPLRLKNLIDKNLPAVYADEDHTIQIFHNLIGNAIKFTSSGEISVRAEIREEAPAETAEKQTGEQPGEASTKSVYISVIDTGIGIPEDQQESIFEAFHQVEDSVHRSQGGTGLGLSITKQLVQLHGGKMTIKSAPGKGSEFGFTLPLAAEGIKAANRPTGSQPAPETFSPLADETIQPGETNSISTSTADQNTGLNANILIVDDDAINRKVLSNYLALTNYRVFEARGGNEAIEVINQEKNIDLVLLDVMMPQMSGYDTCKKLREGYSAQQLPIIFLTARNQMNDLVTGFSLGANDFLHKPIAREELLARVHTHLQLQDAHRNLDKKVAERTAELALKNLYLKHMQESLGRTNEKLEEASLTDPLTGLHNRRFLKKFIGTDISIVERNYSNWVKNPQGETPDENDLVFMLLDIDHFKLINDQHGHSAGDQVLEQLSALLLKTLRTSDYLIRWGGEEFLLIMRFCARQQAVEMAERIRQSVASHIFTTESGNQMRITCSIGFSPYPFHVNHPTAISWEHTIGIADRSLYAAKNAGRNCWVGIEPTEDAGAAPYLPTTGEDLLPLVTAGKLRLLSLNDRPIDKI